MYIRCKLKFVLKGLRYRFQCLVMQGIRPTLLGISSFPLSTLLDLHFTARWTENVTFQSFNRNQKLNFRRGRDKKTLKIPIVSARWHHINFIQSYILIGICVNFYFFCKFIICAYASLCVFYSPILNFIRKTRRRTRTTMMCTDSYVIVLLLYIQRYILRINISLWTSLLVLLTCKCWNG